MSKDSQTPSVFIYGYYLNYETRYRNHSNPRISLLYMYISVINLIVWIYHFCGIYNCNKSQRWSRTGA